NTEGYDAIVENPFLEAAREPLSTFSIDVDTASYSNVRRFLVHSMLPPRGAVRIEEFVNTFDYAYAEPIDEHPFSVDVEVATCPWRTGNRLVRIGLKGRTVPKDRRPASNLVFLLDVSGSMQPANKLPLVQQAMRELTAQLDERDRVGIVTYAGTSGLVLPSTPGHEKDAVLGAIDRLRASGSTNGAAGIQLAYEQAVQHFVEGGINRVILCTDGDFNVGVTSHSELVSLIEDRARTGVFLSVLGFGMGNYKDDRLEKLADRGNGHYAYIDGEREARRVLVDGLAGTLITIAKDVKIQVEFNPAEVAAYRLLGYENRALTNRDFNDDAKDAGEIGAGHTVTAFYEVVPAGGTVPGPATDPLKYQAPAQPRADAAHSGELLTVKLRYKLPAGTTSTKLEVAAVDHGATWSQASRDFKFAAAVASFAMLLRDSAFRGTATFEQILELAEEGKGADPRGQRAEFLELVRQAKGLKR
ncbi:MAG: VWA domain-containing protein, partial [Planctomycetes bacterium]|nr:VWA domain-containing protein [Planctomycetota bacterium]